MCVLRIKETAKNPLAIRPWQKVLGRGGQKPGDAFSKFKIHTTDFIGFYKRMAR